MKSFPRWWRRGWTASNVFTPNIPPRRPEHYLEIADKYHLLVTGGSDCHGMSKGKPLIGTVKLPYQQVEKLKDESAFATRKCGMLVTRPRSSTSSSNRQLQLMGLIRQIQGRPAENSQQADARNQTHRHALAQTRGRHARGTGSGADRRRSGHGDDDANHRGGQKRLRNPGRRGLGCVRRCAR